ncbi:MAG: class I SAM-dependent methyltransferase [Bryobacterales bacterium]|nr:class I SAM-dependent methyltransferase [Bryobacterales bacterium]
METDMPSDTYRWLALYYDRLFEFRRPFDVARQYIVAPLLHEVRSACDLCCGTGTLALDLAQSGIRVYAVDLSPDMVRIARRKVRAAGLPVRVLRADMRDFRLPQPVDLITCEFDALNHVPTKGDLRKVLRCAARALRPGGYFTFDVNNLAAFEHIWSKTWFIDRDPVAIVMRGNHRRGSSRASIDVEWFIRKGKVWTRHHEHIEEVCWTPAEIRQAFTAAGFDHVRCWDAAPFFNDGMTSPGCRTFWRARKKPTEMA